MASIYIMAFVYSSAGQSLNETSSLIRAVKLVGDSAHMSVTPAASDQLWCAALYRDCNWEGLLAFSLCLVSFDSQIHE